VVALSAAGGPLQGWPGQPGLQQWAGTQLLAAGVSALGSPASAPAQADVLQLLRTLLAQQLASAPGPRQARAPVRSGLSFHDEVVSTFYYGRAAAA